MTPPSATHGLLDTSVVIALGRVPDEALPAEPSICAITLAELSAGPHAADDADADAERARRQEQLQRIEAVMDSLPFDDHAARTYGRVYAATRAAGRKARGARAVDLLIAAVAVAENLPLYTCNPDDFTHLSAIGLEIREVRLNA